MSRVRARRAHDRRQDWPLSVEDELASGRVDLAAFRSPLARIYASQAQRALTPPHLDHEHAVRRLVRARDHEAVHRSNHREVPA